MALTQVSRGLLSTSIVDNGNATAITIDASENVLVGKTAVDTNTAGFEARSTGFIGVTRADVGAYFTRLSTDGEIIQFRKGSAPVGQIGTIIGYLTVGTGDSGLLFNDADNAIQPWNITSNSSNDATTSLGRSSHRFTDLYLSGGAYLGGVASANKLDDYEEGTWTLGLNTSNSDATISSVNTTGYYTKIGNLVTVNIYNAGSNITVAGSGSARITGLPFTVANANGYYSTVTFGHTTLCTTQVEAYAAVNQNYCVITQAGTITNAVFATGNPKYLIMSLTYMTSQ